jgi:hypothetical protein
MIVFPVTSYPWRSFLSIALLTVGVPLAVVALALFFAHAIPSWLLIFALAVALGFLLSLTVALLAVLLYVATRNEVSLREGTLHLKGGSFHQRVELPAITGARIVDLNTERELQPCQRENGVRLPGYRVGWFRLRDGAWTFVLLAAGRRAVYVTTTKGFSVLLGVKKPARLLNRLAVAEDFNPSDGIDTLYDTSTRAAYKQAGDSRH